MNITLTSDNTALSPGFLKIIKMWKLRLTENIRLLNSNEGINPDSAAEEIISGMVFLKSSSKSFAVFKLEFTVDLLLQLEEKFKLFNNFFHTSLFSTFLNCKIKIDEEMLSELFNELENQAVKSEVLNLVPESYGVIYEYLKYISIKSGSGIKGKRKSGGVYYTPIYIVDYIVEKTLGKKLKEQKQISELRIYDPACGSGVFLLRAYDFIINYLPDIKPDQKKEIILNCIFGTDLDHNAIEVTKFSFLMKLIEGENDSALPDLSQNFDCINFLFDKTPLFDHFSGKFDIIIGNPPYSAELTEHERKILKKKFNLGTTDTAAIFMSVANEKLISGGINGFIIPKPFVYSSNWKKLRENLLPGLIELIDCGKAWKEVKLEQVIYFYVKDKNFKLYSSGIRKDEEICITGKIDKELYYDFELLLNGISEDELKIGLKMKSPALFLNDLVSNHRGAPLQEFLSDDESDFKVIGGKQIQHYTINGGFKGYFPLEKLNDSRAIIKDDSILVQNIVAHVQKPEPAIKIIAALGESFDRKNYLILDTVNQLQNKSGYASAFICAILNSKLISWYVYNFIFGRAVRTMHFDNYVTRRIPFPSVDLNNGVHAMHYEKMNKLVRKLSEKKKEDLQQYRISRTVKKLKDEIEEIVLWFYNISSEERTIIYREGRK